MDNQLYTVDENTVASAPGDLTVSRTRWVLRYPVWPVSLALLFVATYVLTKVHWSGYVVVFIAAMANFFYWKRIEEHFRAGDANPGLIIGVNPLRIAVRTDLSKGVGHYPVIKIFREPPSSRFGDDLNVIGKRVATVSLYADDEEDAPYWSDFHPMTIEPIAKSAKDVERLMASFTDGQWRALDEGLARLTVKSLGLHRLRTDEADWNPGPLRRPRSRP